ncbi:hypothetical protein ACJ5NV_17360 [Loktanella agnita]
MSDGRIEFGNLLQISRPGICLQGLTISQLLQRFGWSRSASVTKTGRAALSRLQGM